MILNTNYTVIQIFQLNIWATLFAIAFSFFLFSTIDIVSIIAIFQKKFLLINLDKCMIT